MANSDDNESAIGFNSDGASLEIRNTADFSNRVLPKYFKHRNVSSFIRQLNNYGFRTIPSPKGVFQTFIHEHFLKGRKDLIKFVVRRTNGSEPKKKKTLYEQVVELKQRDKERNQRLDELEHRELMRTTYIKDLEQQLRSVGEERDNLLRENQHLIMILSGGGGGAVSVSPAMPQAASSNVNSMSNMATTSRQQPGPEAQMMGPAKRTRNSQNSAQSSSSSSAARIYPPPPPQTHPAAHAHHLAVAGAAIPPPPGQSTGQQVWTNLYDGHYPHGSTPQGLIMNAMQQNQRDSNELEWLTRLS